MDISTLTSLITSFRAETRQNAITPESLGALLQKIADVLEEAAEGSDVQQILNWKDIATGIGNVLMNITLGNDNANNITLTIGKVNLKTGAKSATLFTLRPATASRAGVMTAEQCTNLNSLATKMDLVERLTLKVTSSAKNVKIALVDNSEELFNDPTQLAALLPIATSAQAGILTAEDYKRIRYSSSAQPFFHIQCDTKDDVLYVKYPSDVISAGYVPYFVRYSVKNTRYRSIEQRDDPGARNRGPAMRGWHLFYDQKKIKVALDGQVSIMYPTNQEFWEHAESFTETTDPRYLFGNIRPEYVEEKLKGYRVGFGGKTYKIGLSNNHRFRFGIVFGPPLSEMARKTLDFSKCVSNIAEFYVNIKAPAIGVYENYDDRWETYIRFSV